VPAEPRTPGRRPDTGEPGPGAGPAARTRIKLPVDPYAESTPRRPRRRVPFIAVGFVLALLAVIAIVNRGHGSGKAGAAAASSPAPGATATVTATAPAAPVTAPYTAGQATSTAGGVPVGYPHTSNGAEAAAANYVVAFNSADMVHASARDRLVNAIADPAIASTLQGRFDAAYAQIDTTYGLTSAGAAPSGQTFVERAAPVGVTMVSASGDSATVAVWAVTLAGLAGVNSQHAVSEDWVTVTVTLNWTHGDWKWFSFQSAEGPAPLGGLQTPAPGTTLQAAVTKYGELRYGR
jgi:hypothetical protein